jgi:hypothetical protein
VRRQWCKSSILNRSAASMENQEVIQPAPTLTPSSSPSHREVALRTPPLKSETFQINVPLGTRIMKQALTIGSWPTWISSKRTASCTLWSSDPWRHGILGTISNHSAIVAHVTTSSGTAGNTVPRSPSPRSDGLVLPPIANGNLHSDRI